MIIIMDGSVPSDELEKLSELLSSENIGYVPAKDGDELIYVLNGHVSEDMCQRISGRSFVKRVLFTGSRSHVSLSEGKGFSLGTAGFGSELLFAAGPCAVQDEASLFDTACRVKEAGAKILRAGAFKPRTSPDAFQGLGEKALSMIAAAGRKNGLLTVSEIPSERYLDAFSEIDIIQIGARNMQNFELLKSVGSAGRPVLLKRGLASTVDEALYACDYLFRGGCDRVIICERGIRSASGSLRFTLDVGAVALLKKMSGLPVFADPSHAAGRSDMVEALSLAAVAAGADGLIIEVNDHPEDALSDSAQAVSTEALSRIIRVSSLIREARLG